VIAVLASQFDPEAQALVAAWSDAGAALLSAEDLCTSGWIFYPSDPAKGVAIVSGRRVKISELRAVLTRRPAVVAEELACINSADRAYVAAETNAFLVAWLSALPCRVVNRPAPNSLCGPAWDALHWRAAATKAGLVWDNSPTRRQPHSVVVCGPNALFARNQQEKVLALTLARAASVELLAVRFRGGKICGACVAPDLTNEQVRGALLKLLLEAE
jgi:hypothetical protein